ncbi:MAG: hypothetical protein WB622_10660, partial [Acidobacteriaceae bacterium]
RHGYFDDGSNQMEPTEKTRTVLRANGTKDVVPNDRSEPIVFRVEVAPVLAAAAAAEGENLRPKRGQAPYEIRYLVPAGDVHATSVHGNEATMVVGTAVLAFDHDGQTVARGFWKVTLAVDAEKAGTTSNATVMVHQTVNLPFGRDYLYLALWDTTTGRLGTVEADVKVTKPVAGSQ